MGAAGRVPIALRARNIEPALGESHVGRSAGPTASAMSLRHIDLGRSHGGSLFENAVVGLVKRSVRGRIWGTCCGAESVGAPRRRNIAHPAQPIGNGASASFEHPVSGSGKYRRQSRASHGLTETRGWSLGRMSIILRIPTIYTRVGDEWGVRPTSCTLAT
jgi:hypothetical protein